jgi:hypothetical protein
MVEWLKVKALSSNPRTAKRPNKTKTTKNKLTSKIY